MCDSFHNSYQVVFLFRLHTTIGMSELVKERPQDPVEFLASYLLKHNPQKSDQSGPKYN